MNTQKDNILWEIVNEVVARQRQSLTSQALSCLIRGVKSKNKKTGRHGKTLPYLKIVQKKINPV